MSPRYLFRFLRYRRDDERAARFAHAFVYALSLVHGPSVDPDREGPVFRIPRSVVEGREHVRMMNLVEIDESRDWPDRQLSFPYAALGTACAIRVGDMDEAWGLAPTIFHDDALFRAASYLRASQDRFFVYPGELRGAMEAGGTPAVPGPERTRFEDALQNAFKAVEAVVGDPPKDDRGFFQKLRAAGLDPHEEVGYDRKQELQLVLRNMSRSRDTRSAHGSTRKQVLTLGELVEYQACAHYVVASAVEAKRRLLGWA